MALQGYLRNNVSKNVLKGATIILCLTVTIVIIRNIDPLKDQIINVIQADRLPAFKQAKTNHTNSSTILKRGTIAPPVPHDFCTFKPLTATDAEEERLILDSIGWRDPPFLPSPLSLNQTSHTAHSYFTILPGKDVGVRHVVDELEVVIKMYDFQGSAKKFGGDVLVTRLHNKKLGAGVAGRVVDHLNGSYSAVFTLLWEGATQVEVMLVHPSEAVTVLRRLNREHPDRIIFSSVSRSGSVSEAVTCNVCLRQTDQPQCNFTDLRTGDPWFCYKPKNLSCGFRVNHVKTGYKKVLKAEEKILFQRGVNLKALIHASGPSSTNVMPERKGQPRASQENLKSGLSGYYFHGLWQSLRGTKVHQFNNTSVISQCLKGKKVYLYGDSTTRQWYEYLVAVLPDAKTVDLNSPKPAGPYMIWDDANKFLITYRSHGLPLRISTTPISKETYIANELDMLLGGPNTVVVIGICAHLSTFPIQLYMRRLLSIRRAVVRLLNRAPSTLVVIKTGTLTTVLPSNLEGNTDWFSIQADKLLRVVFRGLDVKMVDAWDMVYAHYLPHAIHPERPIIKNMVDVLLSYICPKK